MISLHRTVMASAAALLFVAVPAVAQQEPTSDWGRVGRLQGRVATVTKRAAEPTRAILVLADQSRVVLAMPVDTLSSSDWAYLLHKAALQWNSVETGAERLTARGGREIRREGLFEHGTKVATWVSVPREEIAGIDGTVRKRGGIKGLIIGAGAGVGAALAVGFAGEYMNNEGGGGDVLVAAAPLLPVVGGVLGYFGSTRHTKVRYVAPTASPLDDEAWQHVRAALPASLRLGRAPRG